jgi:choline dehydrogenase-like flavoprotein
MVRKIETDTSGRAVGVSYFDGAGNVVSARAEVVVAAGGAIETARLLLASATAAEPTGLGNNADQVGRHLQGHYYAGAAGLFPDTVWDMDGPGVSTGTCRFNHGNDGIIGGGLLTDTFILLPIIFRKRQMPPGVPGWGLANKQFMRESYRRVFDIRGPVHEIPSPDARVTLDPDVRDRHGLPVARLSGTTHPETVRTAAFLRERAVEWLRACGALETWGAAPGLYLSAGQHQAGTCRMGDDPAASVVDSWCRVHGHDNLFIADGSVHVTNGGFNPVHTIMSLAYRTAENILRQW